MNSRKEYASFPLLQEKKYSFAYCLLGQSSEAIAIDDAFATAHFNLGLALEAIGDRSGARAAYERTLELDPSDQEARSRLAQ